MSVSDLVKSHTACLSHGLQLEKLCKLAHNKTPLHSVDSMTWVTPNNII